MNLTRAFVASGILAAGASLQPIPVAAQASERAVYASVIDADGQPVEGLNAAAFVVREDGLAREILRVVPAGEPMQIALLVDNSAAAAATISSLRQALTGFLTAMTEPAEGGGRHEVAIITLAGRPTIMASYTTDRETLLTAANRIFVESSSAAYLMDAIVETSQGLARRGAMRPVIIAITTEGPDYSTRNRNQALAALDLAGGIFHAVIVGPSATDFSEEGRDRAIVLGQGPEDHGGRREILFTATAVPNALLRLAAELRSQYKITYSRPQTLIPPDEVTVSAADPRVKAYGVPVRDPDGRGGR